MVLKNFTDAFELAAKWEVHAKALIVKSEKDTDLMEMARVGRLKLREKRIQIEKTRVAMKADSVREGKAIDGIANVLKGVIVPIEEFLGEQEHYIKNKQAASIIWRQLQQNLQLTGLPA